MSERCARGKEDRLRAVVLADPHQTTEDSRYVGTEDAAVGVNFIDHDVSQIRKERGPFWMVRQHGGMQHIWVREHEIGLAADAAALRSGRVAVVNAGANSAS